MSAFREALNRFLTVLFPKRCDLCGEVVAFDEIRCSDCRDAKTITKSICTKCGREVAKCTCTQEKFSPRYKAFAAPYYFEGSRRAAVYRLKNGGYTELVPPMAEAIADTVRLRFHEVHFDVVTFVPMTKRKQKKRGFNQSELLATAVAKRLLLPCEELLVKTKETHSQRTSGARERKVNLFGAFDLKETGIAQGKTVLVIDDVKTTGSTLNECASVLMAHKAKAVYAAAFTVTDKKDG